MFKNLWPSPDDKKKAWRFKTSFDDYERRWTEDGWRSPVPQKAEAFFEINLRKGRLIRAIQIFHGDSFETPKRWYMFIRTISNGYAFFGRNSVRKDGEGVIIVTLPEPQKIQFIRVIIVEPEMKQDGSPYYWAVKEIRLKEVRIPNVWEPILK